MTTHNKLDWLGKLVREAWIRWASKQENPKPSWLEPWENLSEEMKEVDRQIGAAIAEEVFKMAADLVQRDFKYLDEEKGDQVTDTIARSFRRKAAHYGKYK
jgi:hypothetical protein